MTLHRLDPSPATCRWGLFDAAFAPVLMVQPGDSVTIATVSGVPAVMPPEGSPFTPDPRLLQIHAELERAPGHIITGPVAIAGAEPGDMLEVRIEAVEITQDWGYCGFRPLAGTLPREFDRPFLTHIPVDRARGTARLPYGPELQLAPFFGVMGVAPPPTFGAISTVQPRQHGGNLDNKELVAGSTLFLPVWATGALFSCGDGHGVQGDGEVCINALEIDLAGTFTFVLHKNAALRFPRAETPTHFISMGLHEDLDTAMRMALREMIGFICSRSELSREQAYQFCSLAVDFRVTQTVNGEKGIHGMLKRGLLF
ncbi:acetamidase/formamidase family protein [Lichenicola sp.]|uniref:acetamidase/formamidase family protein n=1 Tax=Lichenicola sp. TaxID=2804529 RepID=UPI003B00C99F